MKVFKSVKRIKLASLDELTKSCWFVKSSKNISRISLAFSNFPLWGKQSNSILLFLLPFFSLSQNINKDKNVKVGTGLKWRWR